MAEKDDSADNVYVGPRDGSELSLTSKEHIRQQLEDDIQKFLSTGGEIKQVDPHVTADPPKRPQSNYGSRPI